MARRNASLGYAREKLGEVAHVLATDPADVRGRVQLAAQYLCAVPAQALPPHLRQRLEALMRDLNEKQPSNRFERKAGAIALTLRGKRTKACAKFAERMYALAVEVDFWADRQD